MKVHKSFTSLQDVLDTCSSAEKQQTYHTYMAKPQYNSVLFSQTLDKHCALKLVKQMDIAKGERKTQSTKFHGVLPNLVFQPVTFNIRCQITS